MSQLKRPFHTESIFANVAMDELATSHVLALQGIGLTKPEAGNGTSGACFRAIRSALEKQMAQLKTLPMTAAPHAAPSAEAMERINLALHSTVLAERRRHPRFPLTADCRITNGGKIHHLKTLDISASGMRVYGPGASQIPIGSCLIAEISGLGPLQCVMRHIGMNGANLVFVSPITSVQSAILKGILLRLSMEHEFLIARAKNLAFVVQKLFEKGISDGKTSMEALFDKAYQAIPGTHPAQYLTVASGFYESCLPEPLEKALHSLPAQIYCVATDRNGYVPVHHAQFSQPQKTGDAIHNEQMARNRRIFNDPVTLRAARFSKLALVQNFPRNIGNHPDSLVLEASAPVDVQGRRWGCVQMAFSAHSKI